MKVSGNTLSGKLLLINFKTLQTFIMKVDLEGKNTVKGNNKGVFCEWLDSQQCRVAYK
jgi:hypothetical protein